jgi:hypothetical protein
MRVAHILTNISEILPWDSERTRFDRSTARNQSCLLSLKQQGAGVRRSCSSGGGRND